MKSITTLTLALLLPLLACCHRDGTINKSDDNAPENFKRHLGVNFGQSPATLINNLANINVLPSNMFDIYTEYEGAFDFNGDVYNRFTIDNCNGRISSIMYEYTPEEDKGDAQLIYDKYMELYKPDILFKPGKKDPYLITHLYNDSILVEIDYNDETHTVIVSITDYKVNNSPIPGYAELIRDLRKKK